MPVQIQFQLSDKTAKDIAAAFDRADHEVICRAFAQLALRHFHGWITGVDRYRSLTDQYIKWVEDIYDELLPATESPNVGRLYNGFNMPYGQASYVARTLANKTLKKWRQQAIKDLLGDIERVWPTAQGYLKKQGEEDRPVQIRTSRLGALELQRICDDLWSKDRSFVSATPKGAQGEQRTMEIPAISLKLVRDTLKAKP